MSRAAWILAGLTALWLFLAVQSLLHEPPAALAPEPEPVDMSDLSAQKQALINTLLPAIRENNEALMRARQRVQRLRKLLRTGAVLRPQDRDWLDEQAERYRVPDTTSPDVQWLDKLLRRVDIIPADLALAQGAIESAWGQSRFAREGRNYFGHWCFTAGCGLVPRRRPEGAVHEVKVFASVADSVRLYMENLNSHPVYVRLREVRAQRRARNEPIKGAALAVGLRSYSALGETYVQRLQALIQHNNLERFLRPELYN